MLKNRLLYTCIFFISQLLVVGQKLQVGNYYVKANYSDEGNDNEYAFELYVDNNAVWGNNTFMCLQCNIGGTVYNNAGLCSLGFLNPQCLQYGYVWIPYCQNRDGGPGQYNFYYYLFHSNPNLAQLRIKEPDSDGSIPVYLHAWENDDISDDCTDDGDDEGGQNEDPRQPVQADWKYIEKTPFATHTTELYSPDNAWGAGFEYSWEPPQFDDILVSSQGYQCVTEPVNFTAIAGAFLSKTKNVNGIPVNYFNLGSYWEVIDTVANKIVATSTEPDLTFTYRNDILVSIYPRKLKVKAYPIVHGVTCFPSSTNQSGQLYVTKQEIITVAPPRPGFASVIPHPARCYQEHSGYIEVGGINGLVNVDAPYVYNVKVRKIQDTLTGGDFNKFRTEIKNSRLLRAGIYEIKVSNPDEFGACSFLTTVTITEPPLLTVSTNPTSGVSSFVGDAPSYTGKFNISCFGASDAWIEATGAGGNKTSSNTYNYYLKSITGTNTNIALSQNPNTYRFTGKGPGDYYLYLTDVRGCTAAGGNIHLEEPTELQINRTTVNYPFDLPYNLRCHGDTDGEIRVNASGAVLNYTYSITGSATVNTTQDYHVFTGLGAGFYPIKVTDANGCFKTDTITLKQPPILTLAGLTKISPLCAGGPTGFILPQAGGGVWQKYNYTYNLHNEVSALNARPNTKQDVEIITTVTGTTTFLGIYAGMLTLTITDKNLCKHYSNFELTEPSKLSIYDGEGFVVCKDDSNGVLNAIVNFGVPPYQYAWYRDEITRPIASNFISSVSGINHLPAGSYTLFVKDANQCNGSNANDPQSIDFGLPKTFVVKEPVKLRVTYTPPSPVRCSGENNSDVDLTGSHGWGEYKYSNYKNTEFQSYSTFANLGEGTHTFYIKDGRGCMDSTMVTITGPAPLLTNIVSQQNTRCYRSNDGMIQTSITGGNGGYTVWMNRNNSTPSESKNGAGLTSFSPLVPQSYLFYATDAKGCLSPTVTGIIAEPDTILLSRIQTINAVCGEANGKILTTVTGGTSGYTYEISKRGTVVTTSRPYQKQNSTYVMTATGYSSGTYGFEVSDTNQCKGRFSINVSDLNGPTLTGMALRHPLCSYSNEGQATVSVQSLKQAQYSYAWTNQQSTTVLSRTPQINNLAQGLYSVFVKDVDSCGSSTDVLMTAPGIINIGFEPIDPSCHNYSNGSIQTTITGGTPAYDYQFVSDTAAVPMTGTIPRTNNTHTADFNLLKAVTNANSIVNYTLSLRDANACTATGKTKLQNPGLMVVDFGRDSSTICTGQTITLDAGNAGSKSYKWTYIGASNPAPTYTNQQKIVTGISGTYKVQVISAKDCKAEAAYVLNQSSSLLQALLLAGDTAYVNDTLRMIEISRFPTSLGVSRPDSFKITPSEHLYRKPNQIKEYIYFIPKDTGLMVFNMSVWLGKCSDQMNNSVRVYPAKPRINARKGFAGITYCAAYPNPTTGEMKIHVVLAEEQPIKIEILNIFSLQTLLIREADFSNDYELNFDMSSFSTGIYIAKINSKYGNKEIKIIKE